MESAITEHLDEGDIVRILDGEAEQEELDVWTSHLGSCESCRRLRDEVERQSAWFRSAAPLLDEGAGMDELARARAQAAMRSSLADRERSAPLVVPIPQRNGRGGVNANVRPDRGVHYRLAAAGIAVILFVSLAVEPVRAWILENVFSVASRVEEPVIEDASPPLPAAMSTASARFNARGPVFRIDLDQRQQQAGTLTIRLTEDDLASARIAGSTGETLIVLPDGLRVANGTGSSASYIVELPVAEIRQVVVQAGGEVLATRTLSTAGEDVELDLAAEAVRP